MSPRLPGMRCRSALYALWFLACTVGFGLGGLVVRGLGGDRALAYARAWARAVLWGLQPICGIRVALSGAENLPAHGPALLACQHQAAFDTLFWMVRLKRPSYVMKQELRRIPLFGPMLEPAGMIPVDRTGGSAALRRLLTATEQACADGRTIIIFPEGTRRAPGETGPLQPGLSAIAARLNLPVLPVATDSGRCWTRSWLRRPAGTIHIAIGAPIPTDIPRAELLKRVRDFWDKAEERGFKPVDKSVERALGAGAGKSVGCGEMCGDSGLTDKEIQSETESVRQTLGISQASY